MKLIFFQQPLPLPQRQPSPQQLPQRQPPQRQPQPLPQRHPQPLPQQQPSQLHVWIYMVGFKMMIASRPRQTVERNARFARPNMNHFTMLSSF